MGFPETITEILLISVVTDALTTWFSSVVFEEMESNYLCKLFMIFRISCLFSVSFIIIRDLIQLYLLKSSKNMAFQDRNKFDLYEYLLLFSLEYENESWYKIFNQMI